MRFHVAEFTLVAEHVRKYQRPDFKAEIQLAPPRLRTAPELMGEKNFQVKWKSVMGVYDKLQGTLKALKVPGPCKTAFEAYRQAFLDDQFVAKAVAERMFKAQDLRSRELLREDLKPKFRDTDKDWFDRLFDDFEKDANLSAFYPRFVDLFLEPEFAKAKEEAEKAMKAVGIEYAVATTEDKDIDQQ
jgi:hypothetical protein